MVEDDYTEPTSGLEPTSDPAPSSGFVEQIQRAIESAQPVSQPAPAVDERDTVRQRWLQGLEPDKPQEAPAVGVSPLARELEGEGWFSRLETQHAAEREQERQRAIEDSQGWSSAPMLDSVRGFFGGNRAPISESSRPRTVQDWMQLTPQQRWEQFQATGRLTPEEQQEAARQELETRQRSAPATRGIVERIPELTPGEQRAGGVASGVLNLSRRLLGSVADRQEQALARAQAMVRGEAPLPQYAEWRSLTETGGRTVADMFSTLPLEYAGIITGYAMGAGEGRVGFVDNRLYKFGQEVERAVQQAFPNDPARQFEFSHTLVQGLASTIAFGGQGAIAHLLGAGAKGQLALITLSGMAAQTPGEFARVTQAMERGDANERDRIIVTLANSALGATESLPFANTIAGNARGVAGRLARGAEQAFEETVQEATQQSGQNLARRFTYDPNQDPYEGVAESMLVAVISGFGYGAAFSGGRGAMQIPPQPAAPEEPRVQEARVRGAQPETAAPQPAAPAAPPDAGQPTVSTPAAPEAAQPQPPTLGYDLDGLPGVAAPAPEMPLEAVQPQEAAPAPSLAPEAEPAPAAAPATAEGVAEREPLTRLPRFEDAIQRVPKDAEGNPDVAGLQQRMQDKYGVSSWQQLNLPQRVELFRQLGVETRDREAIASARPAALPPVPTEPEGQLREAIDRILEDRPGEVADAQQMAERFASPDAQARVAEISRVVEENLPRWREQFGSDLRQRGISEADVARIVDESVGIIGGAIQTGGAPATLEALRKYAYEEGQRAALDIIDARPSPAAGQAQPVTEGIAGPIPRPAGGPAAGGGVAGAGAAAGAGGAAAAPVGAGAPTARAEPAAAPAVGGAAVAPAARAPTGAPGVPAQPTGPQRTGAAPAGTGTERAGPGTAGEAQPTGGAQRGVRAGEPAGGAAGVARPPVQNLIQFAQERGLTTDYDVESHIHAGLRSAPQTKTYQRWNARRLKELQDAADATKAAYEAAIAAGEIQAPPKLSNVERLKRTAQGHPDNSSVQAARRLLAKMGVSFEAEPDTEPTPAQRTQLRSIIASRFPLNWGTIQARLGTTPEQMEALRQEALKEGLLRQDRNGAYRRVPQAVQATQPDITISPEDRVEGAIRAREAQTGKPVSPAVRAYAVELLSRLGSPYFMATLNRAKADEGPTPADARDLAAIAGTPVGARAGKAAAFASVEKRHQDHVAFLEKQEAGSEAVETLAAFASGLDMSPEARKARAEAMGFDTSRVWYHLTGRDFDEFALNADPTSHTGGGAVWLRENPSTNPAAHQVSNAREVYSAGARNIPVYIKGRPLPVAVKRQLQDGGKLSGAFPYRITMEENRLLRDMGYDFFERGNEVAIFDPSNIRSVNAAFAEDATPILLASLASATSGGQSQRAELDALGFYSKALEAAKAWPQKKGTPEQVLQHLLKAGAGVKNELEAIGFSKFLEGKKSVTRDEVVSYLRENRVEVREAVYQTSTVERRPGSQRFDEAPGAVGPTRWSAYTLEGVDAQGRPRNPTQRETVLHLPAQMGLSFPEYLAEHRRRFPTSGQSEEAIRRFYDEGHVIPDAGDTLSKNPAVFRDGHFSEPNVVADIMSSLQVDKDGDSTLVPSQLQSGWGQEILKRTRDAVAKQLFGPDGTVRKARLAEIDARTLAIRNEEGDIALVSFQLIGEDQVKRDYPSAHLIPLPRAIQSIAKEPASDVGVRAQELHHRTVALAEEVQNLREERNAYSKPIHRFADLTPDQKSEVSAAISSARQRGEMPAGARDERKIQELRKQLEEDRAEEKKQIAEWEKTPDPTEAQENQRIAAQDRVRLLEAELRTAEAATPHHAIVATTTAWLELTLKHVIRQAIAAGAKSISIPSGDTVLTYNPQGSEEGNADFYDNIVPLTLGKILKGFDKSIKPHKVDTVGSPVDGRQLGKGFTVFPITDKVREQVQAEGLALFSLRDRLSRLGAEERQDTPQYTDAFAARLPETIPAIESWMRKMLPPEIAVRVVDRLVSGGYNLNARYTFMESPRRIFDRAVEVALGTPDGATPPRTLLVKAFHEINHALREYGRLPGGIYGTLLTDKEWQIVVERAKKVGIDEKITILDENGKPTPAIPHYRKWYREMLRAAGFKGAALDQRIEELIDQERVANLGEQWAEGTSFGARIDSFFERIVKFFEAIRNALRGLDFKTYDDVFRSMASGEVARRAEGGRREPTFEPFPYTATPAQVHVSSEEGQEALDIILPAFSPLRSLLASRFIQSASGVANAIASEAPNYIYDRPSTLATQVAGTVATQYAEPLKKAAGRVADLISRIDLAAFAPANGRRVRAAISINGEVFTAPNHALALEQAAEKLGQAVVDAAYRDTSPASGFRDGFVDEAGNFLTRAEAAAYLGLVAPGEDVVLSSEQVRAMEPRAFSLPGFDGTVTEKIKEGGERLRTYSAGGSDLILSEQPDGSWELTFFKAEDASRVLEIVAAIEQDIGKPISPRGWLTPEGYQYWLSVAPDRVKFHVNAGELFGGMWASPRAVEFAEAVLQEAAVSGQDVGPGVPHKAIAYHATDAQFEGPFDLARGGSAQQGSYFGKNGVYLAMDPLDVAGYGKNIKQVELTLVNPYIMPTSNMNIQLSDKDVEDIKARGHDAIIMRLIDKDTATGLLDDSFDKEVFVLEPSALRTVRTFDRDNSADMDFLSDSEWTRYAVPYGEGIADRRRGELRKSATPALRPGDLTDRRDGQRAHLSRLKSSIPQEAFQEARREERYSLASEPPLDMSPEARKARAEQQGFDTSRVWYHGTARDFDQFREADDGGNFGDLDVNVPDDGIWFTDSGARASGFAKLAGRAAQGQGREPALNVRPVYLRYSNPYVHSAEEFANEGISSAPSIFSLRQQGHDALIIQRARWETIDGKLTLVSEGRDVAVFAPSNIRSTSAAFDPSQEGSPILLASFAGGGRPPPRTTPMLPETPASQQVRGLSDIIADLKSALGLTTTQGLYGMRVRDRAGNRSWSFRPQSGIRGQYDANAGVARVRIATDIEAIAKEGGRHVERVFGAPMQAFLNTHAEELATPAAIDTPLPLLNPTGYSGLELDADTQRVLVETATNLRAWQALASAPTRNAVAYREATERAAIPAATLRRRLGRTIADALVTDLMGMTGRPELDYVRERYSAPSAAPPLTPELIRRTLARGESAYANSPSAVMEPEPYHQFRDMANGLSDAVNNRFQVHGIVTGDRGANLLDLLTNGINPNRTLNSGPPRAGAYGVNTTRNHAPFLIVSEPDQMIPQSGVVNVVVQGPAEPLIPSLQASFPNVTFMTVDQARTFFETGVKPARQIGSPSARSTPSPSAAELSEGFADFFRRYITDPDGVKREMPGVYTDFETFLDANDPAMLQDLERVQVEVLSADYKAYREATALERLKADTISDADQRLVTRLKEWFRRNRRDTIRGTAAAAATEIADGAESLASVVYEGAVDETHPFYLLTRKLLEESDLARRTDADGRAISLAVHENPAKLIRSVGDAFKTGLRWIQDGMPSYRHGGDGFEVVMADGRVLGLRPTMAQAQALQATTTEATSIIPVAGRRSRPLREALQLAMGNNWNYQSYENFGTYLTARRAVEEWARYQNGDLERPPIKSYSDGQPANEIATLTNVIREFDHANPNFASAAQVVYGFLWQQAIHDFQAGRLNQAELDYRATRKHFYVPFSRDMRDMMSQRGFGGRATKFTKDQRFKGSDRAILNPIEAIIDQTFHRAAATHYNEVVGALARLMGRVGPNAGAIGERVTKREIIEANDAGFRQIETYIQGLGYDANDAREMVRRVEADFGDTHLLVNFDPTHLGPQRPILLTLYENGERQYVRINDPEWAQNIYSSLNGIGRELTSLFIDSVAAPASILRFGVTSNPAFVLPNIIRDMWSSWILTGGVNPRTWPIVTQVRGLYHEFAQTDMARLYQEAAGLMGGQNVAALSKVRDKADVMALKDKGLHVKPVSLTLATAAGGVAGFALAGPAGAGFGALLGAGLHRGVGKGRFTETMSQFSDISETATRLGVFTEAYKAALAWNPNLTPYQAAQEAAYVARDLIDFGRRGSKMLTAARLVPFMNAAFQGLDKAQRTLLARSDRGNAWSTTKLTSLMAAGASAGFAIAGPVGGAVGTFVAPALATNAAARSAAVRALLAPFTKKDMGIPLSRNEERAQGESAKAWANLLVYTLSLVAAGALYHWFTDDDDEYRRIPPRFRFRNQPLKIGGEWYMFPKAFEWAIPSNIIEAAIESQYANDPRFWERVREGLFDNLAPPGVPQVARMWGDIRSNYDTFRQRPIVAETLRTLPPELQFNAYASQVAIWLSGAVNRRPFVRGAVESVGGTIFGTDFELTPAIIDYTLRTGGGYWGADIQRFSNVTPIFGRGGETSRFTEYPIVGAITRRFTFDPNRVSDAMGRYWELLGREHFGFRRAAQGYKQNNEAYGPEAANQYLATLADPEQQAYALLEASGTPYARRQHPLNRLRGIVESTMDMERDLALERLADTSSTRDPSPIVLSPATRDEVKDALAHIRAIEANNAFVVLQHRQFAGRELLETQPALDILRAASPEAYAEYERRIDRKNVVPFSDVQKWPTERERLLEGWREAMDRDAALIRQGRGRTPRRLPIGSSRPPAELEYQQ